MVWVLLTGMVAVAAGAVGYLAARRSSPPPAPASPVEPPAATGHGVKLEALGGLAAGIAHEINTPVQFIGDSAHFLRDLVRDVAAALARYRELVDASAAGRVAREHIDEDLDLDYLLENGPGAVARVIEGVERVASIVRAMKEFAHPDCPEMADTDLNHAVETTLTVARNEYKYIADLSLALGDLPPVKCHAGEIAQAILNLVVNAAHAMSERAAAGERGLLTVRTFRDGDDVCIAIGDTGAGIPEEIRPRIFEPFFTTKPAGRGSGQGLPISRAIVEKGHGGSLSFTTEVGRGTTFTIRLPMEKVEVAMEAAA